MRARQNWRLLSAFLISWLAVTAALWTIGWVWSGPAFGSFLGGVLLGVLPFFWLTWTVAAGFGNRSMGAEAERWTAAELGKLDDRSWAVVHDVPLEYSNVDHVVIGPGRVYAVESKWTSFGGKNVDTCAGQASYRAQRLAQMLRARGVDREVLPLLVLWGPGVADELGESPQCRRGARVVAGAHADVWLDKIRNAKDRLEVDYPALQAVSDIIEAAEFRRRDLACAADSW